MAVKHVISTRQPIKAAGPGRAAGAADEERPWQSYHGHDPVISHRQMSAAVMSRFERETAVLDAVAQRLQLEW